MTRSPGPFVVLSTVMTLLALTWPQTANADDRRASYDPAKNKPYFFEDDRTPARWKTLPGKLTISDRHFKEGKQSLRWDWSPGAHLVATEPTGIHKMAASKSGGVKAWVYNEKAVDDVLTFRLGSHAEFASNRPQYTFTFGLNYTGWRAMWVCLNEDTERARRPDGEPLAILKITAPPEANGGALYFDIVEFAEDVAWVRSADWQVPFVNRERQTFSEWQRTYDFSTKKPVDPLPKSVTAAESDAFATILRRYEEWVLGRDLDPSIEPVKTRFKAVKSTIRNANEAFAGLNIQRRDGAITGTPFFASRDAYKPKFCRDIFQTFMVPLALDWRLFGNEQSRDRLLDLFDHVHDQGWAAGSALGTLDHETLRASGYAHAVCLMRDELRRTGRLERELDTLHWYLEMGEISAPPEHNGASADRIRSTLFHRLLLVLCMDDSPEKVRAMRNLSRWMNAALDVAPGWADTIKPDGTGFHHRGIYTNAYAPHALHSGALTLYLMHDTKYALSDTAYASLRRALLAQRVMANKYEVAVGVSGRMPFNRGILHRVLPAYAYMALASEPMDREMAGVLKRLWDPADPFIRDDFIPKSVASIMYLDTLGALQDVATIAARNDIPAEAAPAGHWSFPYGALSIHRRDEWMVSVKGWGKYVWSNESHDTENAYGRYVSYGAIQIFGRGDPVNARDSGYAMDGWDWNRWPGATTIHLPLEELARDTKAKARLFSKEPFVGGVSLDGDGLFALRFSDPLHDTSFRFDKSVFCFGDHMVCLGSGVTNNSKEPTETTLFQCLLPTPNAKTWNSVDGAVDALPYERAFDGGRAWMTDAADNGYVVPNARNLRLTRVHQKSMDDDTKRKTEGDFVTALIDHGSAPKDDGYEFMIAVQVSPDETRALAKAPQYIVIRKDANAHIVRDDASGATGYALFEGDKGLEGKETQGLTVRNANLPCMIMERLDGEQLRLSVCDPDLRLVDEPLRGIDEIDEGNLLNESKESRVRLTLAGAWKIADKTSTARVTHTTDDGTVVEFVCKDGLTQTATLAPVNKRKSHLMIEREGF